MRKANAKFIDTVGRHAAALDILRFAGFEDDLGENCSDPAIVFRGDPSELPAFSMAREALRGLVDSLGIVTHAASSSRAAPVQQSHSTPVPAEPRTHASENKRSRIAELTERRLRDPRAFREQARAQGSANRAVGGFVGARQKRAAAAAEPARRSQHFTLADVERMRISDEISGMPNYAEEYRIARMGGPASNYSTLVARSYDPELISRQALDGTNRYRGSKGLAPLRWNEGIARIAAEHAAQMASGAMPFSHDGFDARVRAFPIHHRGAAENLAMNHGLAEVADTAVKGWIESPGHEKNLRGSYNLCGIGTARAPNGAFYLTQLFASGG